MSQNKYPLIQDGPYGPSKAVAGIGERVYISLTNVGSTGAGQWATYVGPLQTRGYSPYGADRHYLRLEGGCEFHYPTDMFFRGQEARLIHAIEWHDPRPCCECDQPRPHELDDYICVVCREKVEFGTYKILYDRFYEKAQAVRRRRGFIAEFPSAA